MGQKSGGFGSSLPGRQRENRSNAVYRSMRQVVSWGPSSGGSVYQISKGGPGRGFFVFWMLVVLVVSSSCRHMEMSESERKGAIESLKSKPLTYVAIGASDTVGVGAGNPALESWVALLSSRLPPDTRFVRLGVSGSTAAEAVKAQVPAAKSAKPDLVTIWLAGNDFSMNVPLDVYDDALTSIIAEVISEGNPRVFVGNLPDLTTVPAYFVQPRQTLAKKLDEWNKTIAKVADENGAILVDLYATSKAVGSSNIGLIAQDGFHPSTQGYRVIADAYWEAMMQDPVLGAVLGSRAQAPVPE